MFILITSLEFNIEAKSAFPIIGKYLQLILTQKRKADTDLPVMVRKHISTIAPFLPDTLQMCMEVPL